mmetsp:Transcript_33113/g.37587  ORF Transcript_33113/g.37587 Transcript_33113/m.37587 type:complete len:449 (-) Transcript_33113:220-1566(-)
MNKVAIIALLGLATLSLVSAYEADRVRAFPDNHPFPFNVYSGYLDIPNNEKKFHYIFQESQSNPATDPVLLWLNGGPGCSSMLGAVTENGYLVNRKNNKDGWMINEYSWNTAANVIYIESPAGVGFSILGDEPKYFDDAQTGEMNTQALLVFFQKFPQFKTHDFYVSGESYAGMYVPFTAKSILDYNKTASDDAKINLKGTLVGNGVTSPEFDGNQDLRLRMANAHALLSDATIKAYLKAGCDVSLELETEPLTKFIEFEAKPSLLGYSDECAALNQQINANLSNINIYNILADCEPSRIVGAPCLNYDYLVSYFNRDDVKKTLHISDEAASWNYCSNMVGANYHSDPRGSIWIYPILKEAGIRTLVYSGDIDFAVPFMGSEAWVDSLNWDLKKEWSQYIVNGQVGGYFKEFDGITYVTVKGSGHMVPQDKPAQAHHFVYAFLNQTEI